MRIVWAGLGFGLALLAAFMVWRVRGLLSWNRSQRKELVALARVRAGAGATRGKALDHILDHCHAIRQSNTLDLNAVKQLPAYWRKIAACYHPDDSQPEMCIRIGDLLAAARQLADRLDDLLKGPGFKSVGKLRVRQVRGIFQWYQDLSASPTIAWILARWQTLRSVRHGLRFLMLDPFIWIAYLSQRLTIMMAVRCLLADLYLFTGKCAVAAYDVEPDRSLVEFEERAAETVLDAYETEYQKKSPPLSPELMQLRSALTSIPGRLWKPPGFDEWWRTVEKSARLIAAEYFPQAREPLEEATCRVLLDRTRYWLQAMADARNLPVVSPLYRIRIKRLLQIKDIGESDLLRRTGKIAGGVWTVWRWARWPLKILQWVRRRSPAGAAVEIGTTLTLKAAHNYMARYGFDHACRELEIVYRLSADEMGKGAAADAETPLLKNGNIE